MSPIKIIWSPLLLQIIMSLDRSDKKAVLGHSRVLMLYKLVRCWAYTELGPPPAVSGTSMYKVIMRIEASTLPLNSFHDHIPRPEVSLSGFNLLPMRFPVVRLDVPPCW